MGLRIYLFIVFLYLNAELVKLDDQDCEDRDIFECHRIEYDILSVIPEEIAPIKYHSVSLTKPGMMISPLAALSPPQVTWNCQPWYNYTLVVVDNDAPLPQFLHWLVVNIPGCDVTKGKVLASYLPPTPSLGTGTHRYVFVIYRHVQGNVLTWSDIPTKFRGLILNRVRFNVEDFGDACGYGDAIAVNFFLS